jgi:hypothetical protein
MDKRLSRRFLCAELVELRWRDKAGRLLRRVANLEDISRRGACVQLEGRMPLDTPVVLHCDGGDLPGTVRYCLHREWSYFVGIEFDKGAQWSQRRFRPQHMLDPWELVLRATRRRTNRKSAYAGLTLLPTANA